MPFTSHSDGHQQAITTNFCCFRTANQAYLMKFSNVCNLELRTFKTVIYFINTEIFAKTVFT